MSTSGVGRGRGWLNLKQNPAELNGVAPIPGLVIQQTENHTPTTDTPVQENEQFQDANTNVITPAHEELIKRMQCLSLVDDGILLNQKLKYIAEYWKDKCTSAEDVENSFTELYNKCLIDSDLATKMVLMVSSQTANGMVYHDSKIRFLFITRMQKDFENCKQTAKSDRLGFRNSVQILGEYYNKNKAGIPKVYQIFSPPLLTYLELLLDEPQVKDLKLFTTQLYMNGGLLKEYFLEDLNKLATKARKLLVSDKKLCNESKLWLLLAVDISAVKYGLLPIEVQKFYQEQLGDKEMAAFQGLQNTLCVKTTLSSKSLDKYQSNVNVLQLSSPPSEAPNNEVILSPQQSTASNLSSSGFSSDTSQNLGRRETTNNLQQPQQQVKGFSENKSGRPILGAGARLNKNRLNNEISSNKNDFSSENSSVWNNKPKTNPGSNWNDGKKAPNSSKSNKGWEHDDRFDNDY